MARITNFALLFWSIWQCVVNNQTQLDSRLLTETVSEEVTSQPLSINITSVLNSSLVGNQATSLPNQTSTNNSAASSDDKDQSLTLQEVLVIKNFTKGDQEGANKDDQPKTRKAGPADQVNKPDILSASNSDDTKTSLSLNEKKPITTATASDDSKSSSKDSDNFLVDIKSIKELQTLLYINKDGNPRFWKKNFRIEDELPIPSNSIIQTDKIYKINLEEASYTLPENTPAGSNYVLKVNGMGLLKIQIYKIESEKEVLVISNDVRFDNQKDFGFVIFDPQYLSKKNQRITLTNVEGTLLVHWYCSLNLIENIELLFNENIKVYTAFAKKFQTKVLIPPSGFDPTASNRLEFAASTSLKEQDITGNESIEMYINQGSIFPSRDKHDIQASGNYGYGLIKTINQDSDFYCVEKNCEYSMTIYVHDLDYFELIAQIFYNGYQFHIKDSLKITEELEKKERVHYQLMIPKSDGDWVFTVKPRENEIELLVNPDELPESDSQYKFKLLANMPSKLTITNLELVKGKEKFESFFVKFRSTDPKKVSTFDLFVQNIPPKMNPPLTQEEMQYGNLIEDQILNYSLSLANDVIEPMEFNLNLNYTGGTLFLIVKECTKENLDCSVSASEIDEVKSNQRHIITDYILKFSKAQILDSTTNQITNDINLHFNCNPLNMEFVPENDYPISTTCKFAVAVYCLNASENRKTPFSLKLAGKLSHIQLHAEESYSVTANEGTIKNFKLRISQHQLKENLEVKFKVIAISGICDIFFSKTNPYPDDDSNDALLQIKAEDFTYLHTAVYNKTIGISNDKVKDEETIYLTVHTKEYCLFDIYPHFVYNKEEIFAYETIKPHVLYHRKIEKSDYYLNKQGKKVYYENLYFDINDGPDFVLQTDNYLEITVNTLVYELVICVQLNTTIFDSTKPCNYTSKTENLIIRDSMDDLKKFGKMVISIQQEVDDSLVNYKLPKEFSIFVNLNEYQKNIKQGWPGKIYKETIPPFKSITFELDLSMAKEHAIVFYESDNIFLKMDILKNESVGEPLEEHLEMFSSGIYIYDIPAFKKKYCSDSCEFIVLIYSINDFESKMSFTYLFDDFPILLKEGQQIKVPNIVPLYFIYESDRVNELVFNMFTSNIHAIAYSRAVRLSELTRNYRLNELISEEKFDFKTGSENILQIAYSDEVQKSFKDMIFLFYIKPKEIFEDFDREKLYNMFKWNETSKVYIDTTINHLEPYSWTNVHIQEDKWKYYALTLKKSMDFSIAMSVESGQAYMFLNKGGDLIPTGKRFWKRTDNGKGDIIIAKETELIQQKISELTFMIGIFALESSKVSLLFFPNFKNIIKIEFQKLFEFDIEKDKDYYLDYYNDQKKFQTLCYSADSDLQLSFLDFDKKDDLVLVDAIERNENFSDPIIIRKDNIPTKNLFKKDNVYGSHLILKIRALNSTSHINFAVFNPKEPLTAYANKWFDYIQDEDSEVYFIIQLGNTYEKVEVKVKSLFGKFEIGVSDVPDNFIETHYMRGKSEKTIDFIVTSANKDITIFREIFIKVKASQASKYSILVKPKEKFLELYDAQPEIIYPNPDSNAYVFYHIKEKDVRSISKFEIEVNTVSVYHNQKPDLLFLTDEQNNINENSVFVPMPIQDMYEKTSYDVNQLIIKPDIKAGSYILKLEPTAQRLPIKVNININNEKIVEPNGLYKGLMESDQTQSELYSLYLAQAGEFRLLLESCSNVSINKAEFVVLENSYTMNFNETSFQEYAYSVLDERNNQFKISDHVMKYPIKKGTVGAAGMLKFRVDLAKSEASKVANIQNNYILMTEFRPMNNEIVLKDYVEIFKQTESNATSYFGYEFLDHRSKLKITNRLPSFKPQLLEDYPDLYKVTITFYYYLFADENLESKLDQCGLAITKVTDNIEKSFQKEFAIEEIRNLTSSTQNVEILFEENELNQFLAAPNLNVLCYMSVRFYDNQDEEWQVGLDLKFTNLPYFVLILNNQFTSYTTFKLLLILSVAVFLFLLVLIYNGITKRKYRQVQRDRLKNNISFVDSTLGSIVANRTNDSINMSMG